jgi:hypothetical protein
MYRAVWFAEGHVMTAPRRELRASLFERVFEA